jgi:hypothetical protein
LQALKASIFKLFCHKKPSSAHLTSQRLSGRRESGLFLTFLAKKHYYSGRNSVLKTLRRLSAGTLGGAAAYGVFSVKRRTICFFGG